MCKYLYILLTFVIIAKNSIAQLNLVPNPGFEEYRQTSSINPYVCDVDSNVVDWFTPQKDYIHSSTGSSDYINNNVGHFYCTVNSNIGGHQMPFEGSAYVGIILRGYKKICDSRENIETILVQPLDSGILYEFKLHYVFGENMYDFTGVHQLGALFTDTVNFCKYDSTCQGWLTFYPIITTPQIAFDIKNPIDSINWKEEVAMFVAKGGEEYLTIGSFENINPIPDNIYLFLDDISVIPIYPANAGDSKKLCKGDSILIGDNNYTEYEYYWFKNGSSDTLSKQGQIWVKPDTTTTYILHQTYNKNYPSSDTIVIDVNYNYCHKENGLIVYPNPGNGQFLFEFKNPIAGNVEIEVFDVIGRKVKDMRFESNDYRANFTVNMIGFGSGVYSYRLSNGENHFSGRLMVVK